MAAAVATAPPLVWSGHTTPALNRQAREYGQTHPTVLQQYKARGAQRLGVSLSNFIAANAATLPNLPLLPFKVFTEVGEQQMVFEVHPHDTHEWRTRLAANISRRIGSPYMVELSIKNAVSANAPLADSSEGIEQLLEAPRYALQVRVPAPGKGVPVPDKDELPEKPTLHSNSIYDPRAYDGINTDERTRKETQREIRKRLGAFRKQVARSISTRLVAEHFDNGRAYDQHLVSEAVFAAIKAAKPVADAFCRKAEVDDAGALITNVASSLQSDLVKLNFDYMVDTARKHGDARVPVAEAIKQSIRGASVWNALGAAATADPQTKPVGGLLSFFFGKKATVACPSKIAVLRHRADMRKPRAAAVVAVSHRTHYREYSSSESDSSSSSSDSSSSSSSSSSDSDSDKDKSVSRAVRHRRNRAPISAVPTQVTNIVYNTKKQVIRGAATVNNDSSSDSSSSDSDDESDKNKNRLAGAVKKTNNLFSYEFSPSALVNLAATAVSNAAIAAATGKKQIGSSVRSTGRGTTMLESETLSDDDNNNVLATSVGIAAAANATTTSSSSRVLQAELLDSNDAEKDVYEDRQLLAELDRQSAAKVQVAPAVATNVIKVRLVNASAHDMRVVSLPDEQVLCEKLAPGQHQKYTPAANTRMVRFEPLKVVGTPVVVTLPENVAHVTVSQHMARDDTLVHAPFPADKPLHAYARVNASNMSMAPIRVQMNGSAQNELIELQPRQQQVLYVRPGRYALSTGSAGASEYAQLHVGNTYSLLASGANTLVVSMDNRNAAQKEAQCSAFLSLPAVRAFVAGKQQRVGTLFVPINAAMARNSSSTNVDPLEYYCEHNARQNIEKPNSLGNVVLTSATNRLYSLDQDKRVVQSESGETAVVHGMWTSASNPGLVLAAIDGVHTQFPNQRVL
jgi:hypothetical protein